jgi:hypothetical protein
VLTFLTALAIMFAVLAAAANWAQREQRRRAAASEFEETEEVLAHARDHR